MKIENPRTLGRSLLFTAKAVDPGDNVSTLCNGCVLHPKNGCSNEINSETGTIGARVNLDSTGVKSLIKNKLSVPCGATTEIIFKA